MIKLELDDGCKFIIKRLTDAGYKAYAVGGCVRDLLSDKTPDDYDIATSASPESTSAVFNEFTVIKTGIKHGTVTVVVEWKNYEVTTFRRDGKYFDGRRPESVDFVTDITEDLSRRDFTVNAMAYNDEEGLIDPFGGEKDIKRRILRCVGNPERRFNEDALRILRLVRFSSSLGYGADRKTSKAAFAASYKLKRVSAERVYCELNKTLLGKNATAALLTFKRIIFAVIPELAATDGFLQKTPWHKYDVYGHIARSVGFAAVDEAERWCMLLHDVAKPECFSFSDGKGHFYGHAKRSAEIADSVFERLKFPTALRQETVFLIENHGYVFKNDEVTLKKLLNKWGYKSFFKLIDVHRADSGAQGTVLSEKERGIIDETDATAKNILSSGECYTLSQLAINGNDVLAFGFKGERVGGVLNYFLNAVIRGDVENDREELLERLKVFK